MSSLPILRVKTADLPVLEARDWAGKVRAALGGGARLVTLFGREMDAASALLTAVLQDDGGALQAVRGTASLEHGYHALSRDFPAAQCFERELHEQLGLKIADHPWLKPIRFEGANRRKMKEYRFYQLEGKDVHEVAVGPIHAGVIEPGSFRFMCLGETVHHLEIQLGYQHRAAESLLLRGDPRRLSHLAETIAGDATIAHAWAYSAAIEALAGAPMDEDAEISRAFGLELERVAMHLSGLAGLCADIAFLQGAATYGRLRTTAINTSMRLCGSRFGRGWVRPGRGSPAGSEGAPAAARDALALLERDLAVINERFLDAAAVRRRFRGVGRLSAEQTLELGLVGMAARSCGVALDQRSSRRGAYSPLPARTVVVEGGDCWARALLRVREMDASLAWLQAALDRGALALAPGSARPLEGLAEGELVVSLCEGWRGEVVHCLETGPRGGLLQYKVQDPSLRNWFGLAQAVRGADISDFPICNKSFDLSYCGNDL